MNVDPRLYSRGGIITERDPEKCIIRLRIPAGMLTPEQTIGIGKIARTYGDGRVHLTVRQTVEIPGVDPGKIVPMLTALKANGTPLGSEREEVVNVTACMGTDHCKYANIDSLALAKQIDERFFGKEMPVKVRIAISACPNGCASERMNEIGITGIREPFRDHDLCTGCGTCQKYCREHAIVIRRGKVVLEKKLCVECGMCVMPCPFDVLRGSEPRYRITVGGRRGRHPKVGRELVTVSDPEVVLEIVGKIIKWTYELASSDVLLSEQLDELEFNELKREIRDQYAERRIIPSEETKNPDYL
jgi:dissimilatory sulfite reductase (desulfoviridin) alpha/beta subunit